MLRTSCLQKMSSHSYNFRFPDSSFICFSDFHIFEGKILALLFTQVQCSGTFCNIALSVRVVLEVYSLRILTVFCCADCEKPLRRGCDFGLYKADLTLRRMLSTYSKVPGSNHRGWLILYRVLKPSEADFGFCAE